MKSALKVLNAVIRLNPARLQIACKKSRYLMIPNRFDTINLSINQLQYFNENLIFFFTPHIV